MGTPWKKKKKASNFGTVRKLTFHLDCDGLRLHRRGADGQSAAVVAGIPSLHVVDAGTQYTKTLINPCNQTITMLFTPRALPTRQWTGAL